MSSSKQIKIDILVDSSSAIAKIDDMNGLTDTLFQSFHDLGTSLIGFGNNLMALTSQIREFFLQSLETPIEFENIVNEAGRALDFTSSELAEFRQKILDTAPGLGLLNTEFALFATEAGKMGIPKDVINEFAVVVAEMETATLAGTDVIAKNFSTVRAIFGLTVEELRAYGGAVNMVDDRIGGSFKTIAEFVNRAGATGKLAGLTASELAALGATFQRLGIVPSRASRATNNFITKMLAIDTLSNSAKTSLENAGFSVEDLSDSFRADFSGTMFTFLEDLSKLDQITQINTLSAVIGKDFVDEIATLLTGLDSYKEAIGHIQDEQALLTKLEDETAKKMETTRFRLDVINSRLEKLSIVLGDSLLPVVNDVLDAVSPILEQVANWITANGELAKKLFIVVGVLSVIAPLIILIGHSILAISLIIKGVGVLASPLGLFLGILGAAFWYLNSIYDIIGKIKVLFTSMFGENGLQLPNFSSVFSAADTSNRTNINFNPIYNIQGLSGNVTDIFSNFLSLVKDNDNEFIDFLTNASSRINRAIFT